jgi:hypothetical protein
MAILYNDSTCWCMKLVFCKNQQCGIQKKRFRTRYAELVFLDPVGSAGDIVQSSATRP